MTYGWAILVVLIAIGVLAYFGVLSPERFLPENLQEYNDVAEDCDERDSYISKVACVKRYWNTRNHTIEPDCSDAADFYKFVFNQIDGINVEKVYPGTLSHVLVIVSFDNTYCLLDQDYLECVNLKSKED